MPWAVYMFKDEGNAQVCAFAVADDDHVRSRGRLGQSALPSQRQTFFFGLLFLRSVVGTGRVHWGNKNKIT